MSETCPRATSAWLRPLEATAHRCCKKERWSELAADNRLVRGSSPPRLTTQSPSNRDFPVLYEKPQIGGDRARVLSLQGCRLDFRGRFYAFVSALQNPVSPRQRPVLVETWFEC
jgi:hypothetical protein